MGDDAVDLRDLFEAMLERPFDEAGEWEHDEITVETGETGHVAVLFESEEFSDDEDGSLAESAAEAVEEKVEDHRTALAEEWGEPFEFDAFPYMTKVPPPLALLLLDHGAGGALLWERDDHVVGLATAQDDEESPIRLLAVVSYRTQFI